MRKITAACGVGMACLSLGAWGLAQAQAAPTYLPASPASAYRAAAAAHPDEVNGLGARVDPKVLASLSGGADVSAKMTLDGTVSNNQADDVVTGANSISAGSFQGAAGVPMVIQNTGNNVLIQNATIINVQFRQ